MMTLSKCDVKLAPFLIFLQNLISSKLFGLLIKSKLKLNL